MTTCDIYAYGVIAASELHLLSMPFPSPDAYAEIAESHFMTGGEALNSAIVLSRLGVSVQLDGNWIGDTPAGERLLATICGYGIDAQRVADGVHPVLAADGRRGRAVPRERGADADGGGTQRGAPVLRHPLR